MDSSREAKNSVAWAHPLLTVARAHRAPLPGGRGLLLPPPHTRGLAGGQQNFKWTHAQHLLQALREYSVQSLLVILFRCLNPLLPEFFFCRFSGHSLR